MSDHNFYLHDSVHILRSNGTTEHAEAVEWAVARLALLESVLAEAGEALEPIESGQKMSTGFGVFLQTGGDKPVDEVIRRAASVSNQIAALKEGGK